MPSTPTSSSSSPAAAAGEQLEDDLLAGLRASDDGPEGRRSPADVSTRT